MITIMIYRQGRDAIAVARVHHYGTQPARSWELVRLNAPVHEGRSHRETAYLMCQALVRALEIDPESPYTD